MNHAACNVESIPLNCWRSVSTAQLVELAADVFEMCLQKTCTTHPASRQPGHDASTRPRPPPTQPGSGSKMGEFRIEG